MKMNFLLKNQSICRITDKCLSARKYKCQNFIVLRIVLAKVEIVTMSFRRKDQKGR